MIDALVVRPRAPPAARTPADFRATSPESAASRQGACCAVSPSAGPTTAVTAMQACGTRRRIPRGLLPGARWQDSQRDPDAADDPRRDARSSPTWLLAYAAAHWSAASSSRSWRCVSVWTWLDPWPGRQLPDIHGVVGRAVYQGIAEQGHLRRPPTDAGGLVQQNAWAFYPLFPLPQPGPHGPHPPRLLLGWLDAVAGLRVRGRPAPLDCCCATDRNLIHCRRSRAVGQRPLPSCSGGLYGGPGDGHCSPSPSWA